MILKDIFHIHTDQWLICTDLRKIQEKFTDQSKICTRFSFLNPPVGDRKHKTNLFEKNFLQFHGNTSKNLAWTLETEYTEKSMKLREFVFEETASVTFFIIFRAK